MFDIETRIRMPSRRQRWAVVADDRCATRAELATFLKERGFCVLEAADGFDALAKIGSCGPAVALLRRRMPAYDGERAAALCRALYPSTRIILTRASADPALAGEDMAIPTVHWPAEQAWLAHWLEEQVE